MTTKEKREVNAFLKAVMETKPMQFCHLYCREKNPDKVPAGRGEFRELLYKIWFDLYRRDGGGYDSSGFGKYYSVLVFLCLLFDFRRGRQSA